MRIITVDLGGTYLRAALVENNNIVDYIKKNTPKTKKKLLLELVKSIEYLKTKKIDGIGVSTAGPLKDGIIKNPPNLPFKYFDIKKFLIKKFKVRVEVENDANCVAMSESVFGCKKKNFFILTIGTGIGGGVIIDGKLYKGEGYASELGHIILKDGYDFEDIWKQDKKLIKKYLGKETIDKSDLKDVKHRKLLNKISDHFAQAIGSLINVFDPEIVVLGGGMKETGAVLLAPIKKMVWKYVIIPKKIPICWTSLNHPEILGAFLLFKK